MRVLIVEDEPLIALSLTAELKQAGHEVVGPSRDADEALCLMERQCADLALIDADLQGSMDGVELARALYVECEIPALLLTSEPTETHAHAYGALGMIALPFDPSDIPESIDIARIVLEGGQPPSAPRSLHLF
ncbi:MAG: response regulator [Xanthomonadaceae bacterium]|nr:response regulator [Xanthomonadaceae bacterium]